MIVISGPNVFAGYMDAAHNKGLWLDIDGQRWLNTGDLGREDQDGYFWLTGRKKELIIRGGHNIDPKQIEDVLQGHPDVTLVAAVGCPDAHSGEVPVAYVQLNPGSHCTTEQLTAFAARHITERAAIPKRIVVVDALPVTPVGKIFKPALLQREIAWVVHQESLSCGMGEVDVKVVQDPQRGLVTQIRCGPQRDPLASRLGHYSFPVEWLELKS